MIVDQKMIRLIIISWSRSWYQHDLDQKIGSSFLIWIKKVQYFFWSGSKKRHFIFDLDQKIYFSFLIQDQKIFIFGSKITRSKNDPPFWSMIYQPWFKATVLKCERQSNSQTQKVNCWRLYRRLRYLTGLSVYLVCKHQFT